MMKLQSLAVLLSIALPAVAAAQVVHTTAVPGRVAGIAATPPPPPAAGNYRFHQVPMVVSADGKVYADFGHGYQQLVRNCSVPLSSFSQPATTQPIVTQPTVYAQPAPNQQTASQQALGQPSPNGPTANASACWATDNRGQPLIGR
jgi:hypothetical protein